MLKYGSKSPLADISDLDTSTTSPTQTSEQATKESSTTSKSSATSPSISSSSRSAPATPGSPIISQSSPTQTQAPMVTLGTGKITGSSTMLIGIPTSVSLYDYEFMTNYAPVPSGLEITTLPPATWTSSKCFIADGDWIKSAGRCWCFTWRQTNILVASSNNVEQVTEFDGTYRPNESCSTTITF